MVEIRTLISRLKEIVEAERRMATSPEDIVKDVSGDMRYIKKGKRLEVDSKGMSIFPDYWMAPVSLYMADHPQKARKLAVDMKEFVNKSVEKKNKKQLKKWLGMKKLPNGLPVPGSSLAAGVGIFALALKFYENVHKELERFVDPKKPEDRNRTVRLVRLKELGIKNLPKKTADVIAPVLLYMATSKNHRNEAMRYAYAAKKLVHRSVKPKPGDIRTSLPNDIPIVVELFARAYLDAEI